MPPIQSSVRTPFLLAFAAVVPLVASCAGGEDVGSVEVALTGQSTSGATYRLRDARIDVVDATTVRSFLTEDDPTRTQLVTRVPSGAYAVDLHDGWRLERVPGDGTAPVNVVATLVSPDPQAIDVAAESVTQAVLRFRVAGEDVAMGEGDVVVVIDVDDSEGVDAGVEEIDAAPAMPPQVVITGGPSGPASASYVSFTFDHQGGDAFCGLTEFINLEPCAGTWTVGGLPNGTHQFIVRVYGPGGTAEAIRTFVTDTIPPTVTFTSTPAPSGPAPVTVQVGFVTSDAVGTQCRTDSGAFTPCTSPYTTTIPVNGPHSITVRAFDAAGNISTATTSFTVQ